MSARRKATPWWREELSLQTKAEVERKIRLIVGKYPDRVPLDAEDAAFCHQVLRHHYQYALKVGAGVGAGVGTGAGTGVAHVEVRTNPSWNGATRGFWFVLTDNTAIDISWVVALQPGGRPTTKNNVTSAARYEVFPQIHAVHADGECGFCPLCNEGMVRGFDLHVDHEVHFDNLLLDWLSQNNLTYEDLEIEDLGLDSRFADRALAEAWQQWHRENAVLRLTHALCNLSRRKAP